MSFTVQPRMAAAAALLIATTLAPGASSQQEPSAAQLARARELAQEGVTMAEAGDCKGAVDKLAQSDKLFRAPVTLVYLGECRIKLGKLVLGTENLRSAQRMPDQGREAVRKAQAKAQSLLDEALPRLAKLRVTVHLPKGVEPRLTIDGDPVPAALLDGDIPADPGQHSVEASAAGYLPDRGTVTLSEGGKGALELSPKVDPNAKAAPTSSASAAPQGSSGAAPTTTAPASSPTLRYVSYGLLGVGVVGLAVGTVFGVSASGKKSDLDKACKNKTCPISAESDYESARSAATLSTVGFGVGAGFAAVGLVLLLTSGSSGESASHGHAPSGVALGPGPGDAGLSLRGGF